MDFRHNQNFIDRMRLLGLGVEDAMILFLIPAATVAWADGKADEKELKAIADRYCGGEGRDFAHGFINTTKKGREFFSKKFVYAAPESGFVENCIDLLLMIIKGLGDKERKQALNVVHRMCEEVAESSGGILGLFKKVSEEEETMMRSIFSKLQIDY